MPPNLHAVLIKVNTYISLSSATWSLLGNSLKKFGTSCLQIFPNFLSPIFLETLILSLNFKADWVATQDKGSCYIYFIVQDITSKTSCVEFITFAKMAINSKLGYFPFPVFICLYRVTSKQTQHMENCGLMLWTLPKVSEHAFLKEPDQPK